MKRTTATKKYLIFGNGFIASHYARHLMAHGALVYVTFHTKKNWDLPSKIQLKTPHDVKDAEQLLRSVAPNYIILTQGLTFIPDNDRELLKSVESNVLSPLTILEALYRLRQRGEGRGVKKILTFGSAAEYGDSDTRKWKENAFDTKPNSFYGLVKHWLFDTARFYASLGVPCVHIRHFNTAGPGQSSSFVISAFCRQIAQMEKRGKKGILTLGDLKQKRDFVDIRDALRAYDLIIGRARGGQIVNLCTGKTHAVEDIVQILSKLSKVPFKTKVNTKLFAHKRRPNKVLAGSPVWLSSHGWKPRFTLPQTVETVLEYWRKTI